MELQLYRSTLNNLRNDIINQREKCLNSLVKFTLGTFCMLSSDTASEFVQNQTPRKQIKKAHSPNGDFE